MKPKHIPTSEVDNYIKTQRVVVIDEYTALLEDLFLIRNPRYKFEKDYSVPLRDFVAEHSDMNDLRGQGNWFHFPWNNLIVHYLPEEMHFELRTARNRNLITTEEQRSLSRARVAIAGMSVGSHCALTLNMMGISKKMKVADPDVLSGSNMNRVRYDFTRVGQPKALVALQQMYQMDPYSEIIAYSDGVNAGNISDFLSDVDILVEETDHLETKIFLREEARKKKIPVVMATDNGDGVIVDIERFDLNPTTKLFNGLIGDITLEEFKTFPPSDLPRLAAKIAGAELIVPRMLSSLSEVGKTLYSWPQLGDAATLSGVAVAYAVKCIALGLPVRSGKIDINLDAIFQP